MLALSGCLLALLLAQLCIPTLLLPQATDVAAWLWILLNVVDVALLDLFFWLKPVWKGAAASIPLGFNLATLAELFYQNFLTEVVAAYLYGMRRKL